MGDKRRRIRGHRLTWKALSACSARFAPELGWELRCECGWHAHSPTKHEGKPLHKEHLRQALPQCKHCARRLPRHEMSKCSANICKKCKTAATRKWAEENPKAWERHLRKSWLKKKYGLTLEDYDRMLASQQGCCAICLRPDDADSRGFRLHVDHNHTTGRVRGLLCGSCNQGMGNLGDDPDRLEAAARYLRERDGRTECALYH